MIGTRVAHYQILQKLGEGGMGVVYKARDTHLDRFVAIKVLPPEKVADPQRKARFVQEAKAASALTHPNIVTVHDISSDSGHDFIAMEYVAGKTLDQIIPRKGMRLGEALKISIQIADALARAHSSGIVHRDLKPGNVIVDEHGQVKVLDFGLAKLREVVPTSQEEATRTLKPTTEEGTVVGTAAYMSPEQAQGKPVDARSDIFSFGAVLYEMTTGQRAFQGDSKQSTIAAVLMKEPKPPSQVVEGLPRELERIILHCLRKDPERRFQNMKDAKVELEELREESESGKLAIEAPPERIRRRWLWAVIAAALVLAAAGAAWRVTQHREEPPPRVVPLTTFAGSETHPSFSPDGKQIVFSWNGERQDNWDLYIKMISSTTTLRLTTDAAPEGYPSWSPDGRQIAFLKGGQRRGVYSISPLGGPERKIADFEAATGAPAWSPDGKSLVMAKVHPMQQPPADAGALFLVPSEGGEPKLFLAPSPGQWYQYPAFSPDGRSLGFAACEGSSGAPGCNVWVVRLSGDLLPQRNPRQLTSTAARLSGIAWASDGRSLVYASGEIENCFLFRVDERGSAEPKRVEIASQGALSPATAHNANWLAFSRAVYDTDIWQLAVGEKPAPLLVSTALDRAAQFSPDGRRIAFTSARGGDRTSIWLANADGTHPAQLTSGPEDRHGSPQWSPDGRWIAFDARGRDGRWNIKVIDSSGGQPRQLTSGPFSSTIPTWSRDGKWIYFACSRTGQSEIWRVPSVGGAAEQITRNGGHMAHESPDARTLYYMKDATTGPLFAQPFGGHEKQVLDRVIERGFEVFDDGIYYLYEDPARAVKPEIRFHDFATGGSRVLGQIAEGTRLGTYLSGSPDRNTFLFTQYASAGSDLMLIENFR